MDINGRYLYEFNNINKTTAALLLKLHINDIKKLLSICKSKGRESEYSDANLAVLIY